MAQAADWWQSTTVYHVYPRSFRDANGDGIGDLRGVIEQLDYLVQLGVETVWLSPFFESPQRDHGYDITDHLRIAPEYGDSDDVDRLFEAAHQRDLKVVLDMVLNHTSSQHPWFLASRSDRSSPFRDYYLWRDGRRPRGVEPPNNWKSALGGSGWHYDETTEQWYFASFLPFQPDLNYRNPNVRAHMLDVVRHWFRRGADGLRLDLFHVLHKDASFADNPFSFRPIPSDENQSGFFQTPRHTIHHPDTLAFARELRRVADSFSPPPRFLVGEVFGDLPTLRSYVGEDDGLHLVFLFKSLTTAFSASAFRRLIRDFEAHFPAPLVPTWVLGNHDRPRVMDRLGKDPDKAKLLAALQLTSRGVPVIYYGDELGLPHHDTPFRDALDPVASRFRFVPTFLHPMLRRRGILLNRDGVRSPMPWHDGPLAGFSASDEARTWLPIHPQSASHNVKSQSEDPQSVLSCYRRLLALRRRSPALSTGTLELCEGDAPRSLLHFRRVAGQEVAHVFLNFGARAHVVAFPRDVREVRSHLHDRVLDRGLSRIDPHEALVGFEPAAQSPARAS